MECPALVKLVGHFKSMGHGMSCSSEAGGTFSSRWDTECPALVKLVGHLKSMGHRMSCSSETGGTFEVNGTQNVLL